MSFESYDYLNKDQIIKSISVERLFGMYDYVLPDSGVLNNAAILYGDNGVGKSTVLRLAFHLLSSHSRGGHRSSLYNSVFNKLTVELNSGYLLSAEVEFKRNKKILVLDIVFENEIIAKWDFTPNDRGRSRYEDDYDFLDETSINNRNLIPEELRKNTKGKWSYLRKLSEIVPKTFILNADRRLDSDSVSDPSDEIELRRKMRFGEPKSISDLVARSREVGLSQALGAAHKWITKKAVEGTNLGAENVHSVYIKVLRQLAPSGIEKGKENSSFDKNQLIEKLEIIERKTKELAKYELATALNTSELQAIIYNDNVSFYNIAVDLLLPYIESLESRLDAVEDIYIILNKFITILNSMLTDKTIGYHLSQGFYISNILGDPLEARHLSSGEQQLLLLFCYVLVARDESSVFMIDEPEISLNIKWQRKLVQSLLDVTSGADIQFIFASHSIELLSMHMDRVIKLVNKNV